MARTATLARAIVNPADKIVTVVRTLSFDGPITRELMPAWIAAVEVVAGAQNGYTVESLHVE